MSSTYNAKLDPVLRPDEAIDHIRGPATASVTVIEYGDFECPISRQARGALEVMREHFSHRVRFVYRHFPLREAHPHAELAAEAAEAAGAQGKFWQMHDLLFAQQQHLDEEHLLACATQLGLDLARYQNEISDHIYLQRVQEHMEGGRHLGVRSTPSFFVNGALADVSFGMEHLHQAIDKALAA